MEEDKDIKAEEVYGALSGESARWLLDDTDIKLELKAMLLGGTITRDPETGQVIIENPTYPYMNKKGVDSTMAIVSGFIKSRIQGAANFSQDEVYKWCKELWLVLALHFTQHSAEYEMSFDSARIVTRMIVNIFHATLSKSIEAKMLDVLRGTERYSYVVNPEKKHIWEFWKV